MTCRHNWTSFLLVGRAHWLIFFFLLIQSVAFTSCCCWTRATAFCRQHTAISHVHSPVRVIEIWILPFFLPPPILLLSWKYCCFYILRSRSGSFCIQICSTIHFSFVPRALRPGVSRRMVGCKIPESWALSNCPVTKWQNDISIIVYHFFLFFSIDGKSALPVSEWKCHPIKCWKGPKGDQNA